MNSVVFMIQDFSQKEVVNQPLYIIQPSLKNLVEAFLVLPLAPFAVYIRGLSSGRLGKEGKIRLGFLSFYTLVIYLYSATHFSFGTLIGFTLGTVLLRQRIIR